MSQIQSNYPRESDTLKGIDTPRLQRLAMPAFFLAVASSIIFIVAISFVVLSKKDSPLEMAAEILMILWFILLIVAVALVSTWIYHAHRAICILRNLEPRLPSIVIAALTFIPVVLFGLPTSYAVEFLLIRSESADRPTMKWTSLWSRSPLANILALLSALPGLLLLGAVVLPMSFGDKSLLIVGAALSFTLSIMFAAAIASRTNRRIAILLKETRPTASA